MKSVFFAQASESDTSNGWIAALRSDLADHIEVAIVADRADMIVIGFATPDGALRATPDDAPNNSEPAAIAGRDHGGVAVLTAKERKNLAVQVQLVAVRSGADRTGLPADLAAFRCYDVSSSDGREALACKLTHSPTRKAAPSTTDALSGVFKIATGIAATLFGSMDKTRAWLSVNVNETAVIAIHIAMVVAVVALLVTGLVALLRLVIELLRTVLNVHASPGWSRGVFIASAVMSLVIVSIFAYKFFPAPPRVDEMVQKQIRDSTDRLMQSQLPTGGIREHPIHGTGQAWVTAQALAGLLAEPAPKRPDWVFVKQALKFLDRAQIAQVTIPTKSLPVFYGDVRTLWPQFGSAKLLFSQYPTTGMLFNEIVDSAGVRDLQPATVEKLEEAIAQSASVTPNDEGWGYFEQFHWGVTEIAGWVAIANVAALRSSAQLGMSDQEAAQIRKKIKGIILLLIQHQFPSDGGFSAISDRSRPGYMRTYSTTMALWAMSEAASPELHIFDEGELRDVNRSIRDALNWLAQTAQDGYWKNNPSSPLNDDPILGLAAQTMCAILRAPVPLDRITQAKVDAMKKSLLSHAAEWAEKDIMANSRAHDSDRYLFPTDRVIEDSSYLWYPWCVALLRGLSQDPLLDADGRETAAAALKRLLARAEEFDKYVDEQFNYVACEGLIGQNWPMNVRNQK